MDDDSKGVGSAGVDAEGGRSKESLDHTYVFVYYRRHSKQLRIVCDLI
jgi:hypothetical protein